MDKHDLFMGKISGVLEWIMAMKPNSINQLLITNDSEIVCSNFIYLGQQREHEQMKPRGENGTLSSPYLINLW